MKDYCVNQMRREYWGKTRIVALLFMLLLLLGAGISALMIARGVETRLILLVLSLLAVLCLVCVGAYLIMSDPKRLMRHTPFGREAEKLGAPESILADIDREAEASLEAYSTFSLTENWLLLRYAAAWRFDGRRTCVHPIPRSAVRALWMAKENVPSGALLRHMVLRCDQGEYDFYCFQPGEADALRRWISPQETNRHA